jgi:hypothetical protein
MPATLAANDLKVKEKVVAASHLPHVPEGTFGKVLTRVGLTWTRYTVLFDNGVVRSTIDRAALARPAEYAERKRRRELGLDEPALVTSGSATGGGGGSGDAGGVAVEAGAVVNGVAVPAHLIERSRSARARLAA